MSSKAHTSCTDVNSQREAGAPSHKTTMLANHITSPDGPCRAAPRNFEAFTTSPRRQLQRGSSCPPPKTDPISHTCPTPRVDPLSTRRLDYGHLTVRERAQRRLGYDATSATGSWKSSDQALSPRQLVTHRTKINWNSANARGYHLAGSEDLLPAATRQRVGADLLPSTDHVRINDRQQLLLFGRAGPKATNTQLLSSPGMVACMGGDPATYSQNSSVGVPTTLQDLSVAPEPANPQTNEKRKSLKLFRDPMRADIGVHKRVQNPERPQKSYSTASVVPHGANQT